MLFTSIYRQFENLRLFYVFPFKIIFERIDLIKSDITCNLIIRHLPAAINVTVLSGPVLISALWKTRYRNVDCAVFAGYFD